jgi:hypothetical protein
MQPHNHDLFREPSEVIATRSGAEDSAAKPERAETQSAQPTHVSVEGLDSISALLQMAIEAGQDLVAELQRQHRNATLAALAGPAREEIGDYNRLAVAREPTGVGNAPTHSRPDPRDFCYNCRSYGPWNGNRCGSCGRMDDGC